jgi:hypothetical protein
MARKNLNDAIHGDRAEIRGFVQKQFDDDFTANGNLDFGGGKGYGLKEFYEQKDTKHYAPCYESHQALKLPGSELVIYGGSCGHPAVKDADIYIGFDKHSMRFSPRSWPWKKGTEFCFPIQDMHAPDDAIEFIKLVDWTVAQLKDGKKVHAGCIGGHGRTGTFLSAVVSRFGEKDACTYVRKHYCEKAVESKSQMQFLNQHFGVKIIAGSKDHSTKTYKSAKDVLDQIKGKKNADPLLSSNRYPPMSGNGSVWEAAPGYEWLQE